MKELTVEGVGLVPGEIRMTPVGELEPHPENPRRGDRDAIRRSIRANGFFQLVVAQAGTGRIIAGNHRWREAVEEGAEELPVYHADVDDARALKILLADNRTADLGGVNYAEVARALSGLVRRGEGLEGTGYTDEELEELVASLRRPGLDELREEYGEPGERDFWPVLRMEVRPEEADRFWSLLSEEDGDDTAVQFEGLVGRLERASE